MTVIALTSPPRSGKGIHLTMLLHDDYKHGHEIFANYTLYFPYTNMKTNNMLRIPFRDVDRHNKSLGIQEADKVFDSRRSYRSENVLLSSLTGQAGKRNLNIYWDSQFASRVDKSLRDVTEFRIYSLAYYNQRKELLAVKYTFCECYTGGFDYPIPISTYTITQPALSWYYKLYDSYEATEPTTKDQSMADIIKGARSARKKTT